MSSEVTNTNVTAQRYETKNFYESDWRGPRNPTSLNIFVGGEYNMNISNCWGVSFSERPCTPSAALEGILRGESDQTVNELTQASFTEIQVPRDLLDRIRNLYQRSMDGNTPQSQVPVIKAQLVQVIHTLFTA